MHDENEMSIFQIFGRNVKKYSELKNISIGELAAQTGIRKQYIKRIMKGDCPGILISHIYAISNVLEIPPYKLVEKC